MRISITADMNKTAEYAIPATFTLEYLSCTKVILITSWQRASPQGLASQVRRRYELTWPNIDDKHSKAENGYAPALIRRTGILKTTYHQNINPFSAHD